MNRGELQYKIVKHFGRINPQAQLMVFDALCGTFKQKDVPTYFVLLKLLRFYLKYKFTKRYYRVPFNCITSW